LGKFWILVRVNLAFVIDAAVEIEPSTWILIPAPAGSAAAVARVIALFDTLMSESRSGL
jgi:hypothetical protein